MTTSESRLKTASGRHCGADLVGAEPLFLRSQVDGRKLVLAAEGKWTSEFASVIEPQILAAIKKRPRVDRVDIDVSKVSRLDTIGAWLVERLRRTWESGGAKTAIVGLDPRYQVLLDEVAASNKERVKKPRRERPLADALEHIGMAAAESIVDLQAIVRFLGVVTVVTGRVLMRPWNFRLTSIVHHLDRVGFRAVPIIVLIQFLIGAILAQQGVFHFRKFGAETYVVDMLGILVLRELGVLIVSIMLAGRSGSAYTAELGSMKMREEMDALRVMGFDPVEVLVLPRLIGLVIALPLLTFIGSMAALFGGGIVIWLYGNMPPEIFFERLRDAISLDTFKVGMIKAPFMAAVIGLVACVEGLRVEGSAESLGEHTTASVVKAIFLVIVLDGLFAMFFAGINM
jgi:phospholipid/cholesterol/gamma-HCH transport system permease protein